MTGRLLEYKWVALADGARWPKHNTGADLVRRLNNVGRAIQRRIIITSGDRSPREAWEARMDYLRGGNLAAQCCWLVGFHSWDECGKTPYSNHAKGKAADCVVETRSRGWVNIGEHRKARKAMDRRGLCLPVGSGETWHVEVGEIWRS